MPSLHRQKRPYAGQATITSFFQPSSDSTASPIEHKVERSLSPALPPSIQSNLLSVGMRVRKSVPEGYKTGSYSAFTLFNENAPQPVPEERKADVERSTRPVMYGARRELTPFCGLMKVGGMAVQEQEVSEDGWICGSQESATSNVSEGSAMGSGKRRFEDEEEEEDEDEMMFVERKLAMPKSRLSKGKTGQENMDLEDFEEAEFLDPQWRGEGMDEI